MGEENALLTASARGNLIKVEKLVDSDVDVNSSDSSKMTTLHYAAMHARDCVIQFLISRGAEENTADMKGCSFAIHWVVNNSVPKYGSTAYHSSEGKQRWSANIAKSRWGNRGKYC